MGTGRQPSRGEHTPPKKPHYDKNIFQKAVSLAKALAFGTRVSQERIEKRIEICSTCEYVKVEDGHPRCGICTCRLGDSVTPQLFSLTTYEETKDHGCHYRDPKTGEEYSKWKKAGV